MNKTINYIDLGLHKGREIEMFLNAMAPTKRSVKVFGFEAYPELAYYCLNKYKNYDNVKIINKAISNKEDTVKLYLATSNNLEGSSIFATKNNVDRNNYIEINSIKLSDWIHQNIPNFKQEINVLRMNIEGAELYVMEDLIASGLYKNIKIYLGSKKNDILKCAEIANRNEGYQKTLKQHDIKFYPYTLATKGRLTDRELRNLVLYSIPPLRLIVQKDRLMVKNFLKKHIINLLNKI